MAEETVKPVSLSPISAAKPPVANPMGAEASEHAATLKLKPVIRKPTIGGGTPIAAGIKLPAAPAVAKPAAPAAPASAEQPAMEQLKTVTQKLKGVTQQIPQQAILRKTGIIADQALTDAQKQASKARTARISLSDAMGVAPVKNEAAPMKTIRIKRPAAPVPTPATVAPAVAPVAESAQPEQQAAPAVDEATVTQRKTLKVSRPGAPGRAPKFGVKKPGAPAADKADGAVADIPEVADIPDMPPVAALPIQQEKEGVEDVPAFVGVLGLIVQVAACIVIGVLGWWLYQDTQVSTF